MSNTLKKAISVMLCIVMMLCIAPLSGFTGLELPGFSSMFSVKVNATDGAYNNYYYLINNGEAKITGCIKSASGEHVIPGTIDGCPVKSIGKMAFEGCTRLTSVTIPDSVTSIGDGAFYRCTGLITITIPDSVTSIGGSAFNSCAGLESVTIGNSVTSIGNYAFYACEGLTSITIPDSVTSIGDYAFEGCSRLTGITVPASVTSIGEEAFFGCTGLESISVDVNNPVYHSAGNCLIETEGKTLVAGCNNSVIPNDNSVTSIGKYAFYGCTGLTGITVPASVTSIGEYAFHGCAGLESVTIGNSVRSIGDYAFNGCTGISGITIPDNVTIIGEYAFQGCTGLKSVIIGNGIKSVSDYAFQGCRGLKSVTIPASVTSIGSYAFNNCVRLTNVTIPDSVTSIGGNAFSYCTGLTSINIPDGVTSIGKSAFYGCTGLTGITIPDSVTSIGGWAFSGCTGLTSITIPRSVTSIGDCAFRGCSGLESITVDGGNTVYHSSGNCLIKTASKTLIAGCENSIIPDDGSVTSIGDSAFCGCTGLESITIPDSITRIGDFAFKNCTGLTDVFYHGTEAQWKEIIIKEGNANLENVNIHFFDDEPAHEHSYTEAITKEPTCKEQGVKTFICVCGDSYTEPVAKLDHTPKTITIAATCTEDGIEFTICSVCEEKLSENMVLPATGHHYDDGVIIKDPTCKDEGIKILTCTCGDSYSEPIKETGHSPIKVIVPATCIENGIEFNMCSICRENLTEVNIIPALGHSFTDYKYNNDATTEKNGTETAKCDRCAATDTRTAHGTKLNLETPDIPINPTANARLNAKSSATVDYKANVTVTASATGVPEGYSLAIYEGYTLREKGNNLNVSYRAGTMTAGRTFTVKVIDSSGNVQKDANGNDLAANCEVKVNSGFFAKLIAFFKGLFGALPNVEIKP